MGGGYPAFLFYSLLGFEPMSSLKLKMKVEIKLGLRNLSTKT